MLVAAPSSLAGGTNTGDLLQTRISLGAVPSSAGAGAYKNGIRKEDVPALVVAVEVSVASVAHLEPDEQLPWMGE